MRKTITSAATWIIVLANVLFYLLTLAVPAPILIEAFNGLLLGAAVAIVISWTPAALGAIRDGAGDGGQQLNLAIWATWTAIMVQRLWAIAYRWVGAPSWMMSSYMNAFVIYTVLVAGILYLTAAGTADGRVPIRNWTTVLVSVAAGALVAGVMIGKFLLGAHPPA